MREILFRGKRTDNGEWAYGVFIPDCLESLRGQDCHWGFIKTYRLEGKYENVKNETVEVDRETVGQYIGLTDKNGKKIFEGDIVSVFEGIIQKVVNENSRYAFHNSNEICCYVLSICKSKDIEVIGNIYDNPEFLEEKK